MSVYEAAGVKGAKNRVPWRSACGPATLRVAAIIDFRAQIDNVLYKVIESIMVSLCNTVTTN